MHPHTRHHEHTCPSSIPTVSHMFLDLFRELLEQVAQPPGKRGLRYAPVHGSTEPVLGQAEALTMQGKRRSTTYVRGHQRMHSELFEGLTMTVRQAHHER